MRKGPGGNLNQFRFKGEPGFGLFPALRRQREVADNNIAATGNNIPVAENILVYLVGHQRLMVISPAVTSPLPETTLP